MEEAKNIQSTQLLGTPVEVETLEGPLDLQDYSISIIRGIVRSVGYDFIHLECRYFYYKDCNHRNAEWYWDKVESPSIKLMSVVHANVKPLSLMTEKDIGSMEMDSILSRSIDDVKWLNPLSEIPEIEIRIHRMFEGKYFPVLKLCDGAVEVKCGMEWWPMSVIADHNLEITLYDDEQSAREAAQEHIRQTWPYASHLTWP